MVTWCFFTTKIIWKQVFQKSDPIFMLSYRRNLVKNILLVANTLTNLTNDLQIIPVKAINIQDRSSTNTRL